jgi:hypothetical protein
MMVANIRQVVLLLEKWTGHALCVEGETKRLQPQEDHLDDPGLRPRCV